MKRKRSNGNDPDAVRRFKRLADFGNGGTSGGLGGPVRTALPVDPVVVTTTLPSPTPQVVPSPAWTGPTLVPPRPPVEPGYVMSPRHNAILKLDKHTHDDPPSYLKIASNDQLDKDDVYWMIMIFLLFCLFIILVSVIVMSYIRSIYDDHTNAALDAMEKEHRAQPQPDLQPPNPLQVDAKKFYADREREKQKEDHKVFLKLMRQKMQKNEQLPAPRELKPAELAEVERQLNIGNAVFPDAPKEEIKEGKKQMRSEDNPMARSDDKQEKVDKKKLDKQDALEKAIEESKRGSKKATRKKKSNQKDDGTKKGGLMRRSKSGNKEKKDKSPKRATSGLKKEVDPKKDENGALASRKTIKLRKKKNAIKKNGNDEKKDGAQSVKIRKPKKKSKGKN